ncbi:uncharacterized protein G2W53_026352 [Senna tora]|uniref:Uncharacterized protein n=1 Tax=Senna tora TaxID=362788 RepID=A0A834WFL0_9FABA|nr:uncharacterized protein G2W53_026352 [Senna tora]
MPAGWCSIEEKHTHLRFGVLDCSCSAAQQRFAVLGPHSVMLVLDCSTDLVFSTSRLLGPHSSTFCLCSAAQLLQRPVFSVLQCSAVLHFVSVCLWEMGMWVAGLRLQYN